MADSVKEKAAIVTGGGRASARPCAWNWRTAAPGAVVADINGDHAGRATARRVGVREEQDVRRPAEETTSAYGRLQHEPARRHVQGATRSARRPR